MEFELYLKTFFSKFYTKNIAFRIICTIPDDPSLKIIYFLWPYYYFFPFLKQSLLDPQCPSSSSYDYSKHNILGGDRRTRSEFLSTPENSLSLFPVKPFLISIMKKVSSGTIYSILNYASIKKTYTHFFFKVGG